MDKKHIDIENGGKISHGLTTPEGYFDAFKATMASRLPENINAEQPDIAERVKTSLWTKVRPYVYMAAMFAGVWCMTKMFSLMKENNTTLNLEHNSVLTAALSNNDFYNDYVVSSIDEYDLLAGMYEQGIDIETFEQ